MPNYDVAMRNARLAAITTFIGNGGRLRIYTGPKPATGAAITTQTLLAEFTMGSPFAPAPASGVLTATLPSSVTAVATGAAVWGRLVRSDGTTFCADFTLSLAGGGGELQIAGSTTINTGNTVNLTSLTLTEGNA